MKKKGLIISTIVMVVVLIASLTTATYAWFSTEASTTVDSMSIAVSAASDIAIGLAGSSSAGADDEYFSGAVTVGGIEYPTDGTVGMGTQLTVTFDESSTITLSSAIGTSSAEAVAGVTASNADEAFDPSHVIFTAPSAKDSTKTQAQNDENFSVADVAAAEVNTDYIALHMGARAAKTGVYGIKCTLKVTTMDGFTTLKDNAALHLYIVVGDKTQEIDVFSGNIGTVAVPVAVGNGTLKSAFTAAGKTVTVGESTDLVETINYKYTTSQAVATIEFDIVPATSTELASDGGGITAFDIYAFVWGDDDDCTSAGTGTTVSFDMSFDKLEAPEEP